MKEITTGKFSMDNLAKGDEAINPWRCAGIGCRGKGTNFVIQHGTFFWLCDKHFVKVQNHPTITLISKTKSEQT